MNRKSHIPKWGRKESSNFLLFTTNLSNSAFRWCSRYSDSNNEWRIGWYLSTKTEYITVWVFRLPRLCMCTRVCVTIRVYIGLLTYCSASWWNTDTPDRKQIMSTQKPGDRHSCHTLMTVKKNIDAENCLPGSEIYETCGNFLWEVVSFPKEHKWVTLLLGEKSLIMVMRMMMINKTSTAVVMHQQLLVYWIWHNLSYYFLVLTMLLLALALCLMGLTLWFMSVDWMHHILSCSGCRPDM